MGETRRKFDRDFREGAVRLVRETGKPSTPASRPRRADPAHPQRDRPPIHLRFGSRIRDEFCLDTVMVIASAETWDPASGADLGAGAASQVCTAESVLCGGKIPARLTLYRGAMIDNPVNGMYSFVLARLASVPDFDRRVWLRRGR